MDSIVKTIDEITERDIVLYFWIEVTAISEQGSRFIRGRKRTMDEGIILCGGDVKRYMEYLRSETCSNG